MINRINGTASYIRQTFSVFLVLCLLLVPFGSIVQAAPSVPVSAKVASVSGAPGDIVDVAVTVDPGDYSVLQYMMQLSYDPNVLEPVISNLVTDKAASMIFNYETSINGIIDVSAGYFDMGFLTAKQEVFVMHFKIKETAGTGNSNVSIVSGIYTEDDELWHNLTSLTPGTVSVAPMSETIKVGIGTASGIPGETVNVPVTVLESSGSAGAYGIQLDYDPAALEVENIVGTSGDFFMYSQSDEEGWLKAAWADISGGDYAVKAGDSLFIVSFKIKDDASTGDKTVTVGNSNDLQNFTFTDTRIVEMEKTFVPGKVTVNEPTNAEAPAISGQPEDRTVDVGGIADLSVTATASGALSYQWYSNTENSTVEGTPLAGETHAAFSAPTNVEGTTYYYVVVKNTDNSKTGQKTATTTSSVAKVIVNSLTNAEAPAISGQPEDRTVSVGGTADLNVTATAGGTLSYQWYSNTENNTVEGTPLAGETHAAFSAPTNTVGTTYYYVVVKNTDNSKTGQKTATTTSSVAKVTVNSLTNAEAPAISGQPEDRTVSVGGTADLSVTATAGGTLSYQWYSNTENSTTEGMPLTGETHAAFSAPTNTVGTTYYYVVVKNTDNSKTGQKTATATSSVAKVTVNSLTNAEALAISGQPEDRTVSVGGTADLNVTATAGGTLSYQWYSNTENNTVEGTPLAGETHAAFSAPTNTVGTTYYYVVVKNTDNSKTGQKTATTTSSVAKVTVNSLTNAEAPAISGQPEDRTVSVGGTADLSVTATAGGTLSYQWYSNTENNTVEGTPLAGKTHAAFSAPTNTVGKTYYYVVVKNTDNSKTGQKTATATSSVAKVTVNSLTNAEAPAISGQPEDRTVSVGGTADLNVTATAGGTLSYQWYSNTENNTVEGTPLAGETHAAFSAPTNTVGTTYYYVVVKNTDNSKTGQKTATTASSVAKVTVNSLTNAEALAISGQPEDRTVSVGGTADLSVTATAGGMLSYQWYSNTENSTAEGTPLAGEIHAAFSAPTNTVGTTYYYVVVKNTDNSKTGQKTATTTSSVAKVTVNSLTNAEAPAISGQPEDRTVSVGGTADLSVTATAGGMLSYQWYSNTENSTADGTPLADETHAAFSAPTNVEGTTYYYVVVTNTDNSKTGEKTASVTSNVAKVAVNSLTNAETPVISAQLDDRTVSVGEAVYLNVTATSSGTLSYQWYSNTENSTTGGTSIIDETNATFSAPTNVEGTTYYYVVVTNTDNSKTGEKTASATSNVAKVAVNSLTNAEAPAISAQPEDRTVSAGGIADLSVTATAGGTLSYQWYSNAADSTTGGTPLAGETNAAFSAPTSVVGTTYYYVVVTNTDNSKTGEKTASVTSSTAKVTVVEPAPSTSAPTETAPSVPTATPAPNTGVDVLVNGVAERAGIAVTSQIGDLKVITVTVDQKKLEDKLAAEGRGATVIVPINADANIVIGELNGQMIKNMENQQAKLVIQTKNASYTLPAVQINIDAVSQQIGSEVSLQDIKVQVKIAAPAAEMAKLVQSESEKGAFELVAPPIDFTVTATYGGETVDVAKFNAYVERTIAIPEGVDPNRVTTAVVIDPDGTVRHVPTQVILNGGVYYAKINSLTNSTYSVIWHPISYKDVEQHWAKEAVNDMGSRMIINGIGNGDFDPDQDITRAEFAAIIVRGLGLKTENSTTPFSDVKSADWYSSFISTAHSYNLINGFEDGTFRPLEKITREQAMVILAKAIKITGLKSNLQTNNGEELLNSFVDSGHASAWAATSITDILQAGIVLGRSDHRLVPEAPISRAEVAVTVKRLLQKSGLI